jgi:hypothetical protein
MAKVVTSERWKKIPGYQYYEASNLGRVRSTDRLRPGRYGLILQRGRILKQGTINSGYRLVHFSEDGIRTAHTVHRLVLAAFRGLDLDDPEVLGMHRDDDKSNNFLSNLRIGTTADNIEDKVKKGRARGNTSTDRSGSRNSVALINEKIAKKIYLLARDSSMTMKDIGAKFGVTGATVGHILNRKQWVHATEGL